jgi:hypothetical protein
MLDLLLFLKHIFMECHSNIFNICTNQPRTLQHLATGECPGLHASLVTAMTLWKTFLLNNYILFPVIKQYSLGAPADFLAFLVDHTATCYIPDTWIYYI